MLSVDFKVISSPAQMKYLLELEFYKQKINIVNMPKGLLFSFSRHSVSVHLVL